MDCPALHSTPGSPLCLAPPAVPRGEVTTHHSRWPLDPSDSVWASGLLGSPPPGSLVGWGPGPAAAAAAAVPGAASCDPDAAAAVPTASAAAGWEVGLGPNVPASSSDTATAVCSEFLAGPSSATPTPGSGLLPAPTALGGASAPGEPAASCAMAAGCSCAGVLLAGLWVLPTSPEV
jgi:hypothetical protein